MKKETQKEKEYFGKLKYPIHLYEDEADLLNYCKEWKGVFEKYDYQRGKNNEEESPLKERDKVIKYIVFAFDKNSGLVKTYEDIKLRRVQAAEYAGFKRVEETGDFHAHVQELMQMKVPYINSYIIEYLRLTNHHKFVLLLANEEQFYEAIGMRLSPISDDLDDEKKLKALQLKSKAREECEMIVEKIASLREVIFGNNEDLAEFNDKHQSELTQFQTVEKHKDKNWTQEEYKKKF